MYIKEGLIPVIIQDEATKEVLMLAYMNEEALEKTMEHKHKKVHFFSRSRQAIWKKGETSGNYLLAQEIIFDCDNDALLIKVKATGPACHTGKTTCFFNSIWKVTI